MIVILIGIVFFSVLKAQTLQIVNDTNCIKQDSVHLFYKIGILETDSFSFIEYKYQYTINKKLKYKINNSYNLNLYKVYIHADVDGINMYFIRATGIPTFKIIIRLREISYIVHVENYNFVKIIPAV